MGNKSRLASKITCYSIETNEELGLDMTWSLLNLIVTKLSIRFYGGFYVRLGNNWLVKFSWYSIFDSIS